MAKNNADESHELAPGQAIAKPNMVAAWTVTAIWLFLAASYLIDNWVSVQGKANLLGDFLAGAVAPLAFFWLIYGSYLQREELKLQREELKLQREEMQFQRKEMAKSTVQLKAQAKAISANELHARRDTFMRVADLILEELNSVAAEIYRKFSPTDLSTFQRNWLLFSNGDKSIFCRSLMNMSGNQNASIEYLKDVLNRKEGLRKSVLDSMSRYIATFERLLDEAASCDPDEMLRDTLKAGELGNLYEFLKRLNSLFEVDD